MKEKEGILLINIGTPDDPSVPAVRRYLREFLMDPRVISISFVLRFVLVNFLILPFRPKKSAAAYQKVWMKDGSPLMVHSKRFLEKLRRKIQSQNCLVQLGMRYGHPSIAQALQEFVTQGVGRIKVLPLFPQYSTAATASAMESVQKNLHRLKSSAVLETVEYFHDRPEFIDAFAKIIAKQTEKFSFDLLLLSYHGLPENHCSALDSSGSWCTKNPNCCFESRPENALCYRHHCFETTKALIKNLNLNPKQVVTSFQSRLGRTPWIKPYTDLILKDLYDQGVRKLAVASPSFVADCLETVEEIGIRLREDWLKLGGEDFLLVTSLNDEDVWVDAVQKILDPLKPN